MYTPETWRGVVAPNTNETSLILLERELIEEDSLIYRLANKAIEAVPGLQDVLEYSLDFYEHIDIDNPLFVGENIENYLIGLEDGYYYMLGSMVFASAERLGDEIDITPEVKEILPAKTPNERNRIKQVVAGDAPIDIAWEDYSLDFNSSHLPREDFGDFMFEHPYFNELLSRVVSDENFPRREGFLTGVEICFTAWLQSAEERTGKLLGN